MAVPAWAWTNQPREAHLIWAMSLTMRPRHSHFSFLRVILFLLLARLPCDTCSVVKNVEKWLWPIPANEGCWRLACVRTPQSSVSFGRHIKVCILFAASIWPRSLGWLRALICVSSARLNAIMVAASDAFTHLGYCGNMTPITCVNYAWIEAIICMCESCLNVGGCAGVRHCKALACFCCRPCIHQCVYKMKTQDIYRPGRRIRRSFFFLKEFFDREWHLQGNIM